MAEQVEDMDAGTEVMIEVTQSEIPAMAMEWSEYEKQYANSQCLEQDVRIDHAYPKNSVVKPTNCEYLPKFDCNKCSLQFGCLKDLRWHKKNMHNDGLSFRANKRQCSLCNISFRDENYVSHFELQHNIKLYSENLVFSNLDGFMAWKENIEKDTKAKFIKKFGTRETLNKKIHCFSCHRSGYYHSESRGLRNLKTQGSHKINGFCPANIKVIEAKKDGKCEVHFLKTHIGHESEIGHLPLSSSDRQSLAQKIASRMPFDRILDEIRDSMADSKLERLHLVTKKDLANIARSYNLTSNVNQSGDGSTLEAWVNEVQVGENECILFYKDQGEVCERCPELQVMDFVLILMNDAQCEILKKFGSDCICIDRTHGLNSCGLELVTLLIIDDLKQGFPCSFLISNRTDETVLTLFFSIIKERTGSLTPSVFMSDVANSFFNSWVQVMDSPTTRLYCSWHVDSTWRTNLKRIQGKEMQARVYKILRTLMEEADPSAFKAALVQTINDLYEDSTTSEFGMYFSETFARNYRLWAYCNRVGNGLDINVHLENMHKTIKYIYFHSKNFNSLDKAINGIMKFLKDKLVERLMILNKGKVNKKLKNLRERHRESYSLEGSVEETKEGWLLSTSEGNELVQENETDCRCKLMCTYCLACIHKYTCSCIDACIKWNMCKHIHFICMYRRVPNDSEIQNDENHERKNIEPNVVLVEANQTNGIILEDELLETRQENLKKRFSELVDSLSSVNEIQIAEKSFISLESALTALYSSIENGDQRQLIFTNSIYQR